MTGKPMFAGEVCDASAVNPYRNGVVAHRFVESESHAQPHREKTLWNQSNSE
jgi:hypothetical protein